MYAVNQRQVATHMLKRSLTLWKTNSLLKLAHSAETLTRILWQWKVSSRGEPSSEKILLWGSATIHDIGTPVVSADGCTESEVWELCYFWFGQCTQADEKMLSLKMRSLGNSVRCPNQKWHNPCTSSSVHPSADTTGVPVLVILAMSYRKMFPEEGPPLENTLLRHSIEFSISAGWASFNEEFICKALIPQSHLSYTMGYTTQWAVVVAPFLPSLSLASYTQVPTVSFWGRQHLSQEFYL